MINIDYFVDIRICIVCVCVCVCGDVCASDLTILGIDILENFLLQIRLNI